MNFENRISKTQLDSIDIDKLIDKNRGRNLNVKTIKQEVAYIYIC